MMLIVYSERVLADQVASHCFQTALPISVTLC
jgi:hypothetical protein